MLLALPPEVLARICEFLDPTSLLESRTVCTALATVATATADDSLDFRSRVREARHTFCFLQLLPALIGLLLLGSQISILMASVPRDTKGNGVVSPVPFGLAVASTALYAGLYVLWTLWVCGAVRLRQRTLLGLSVFFCVACVVCAAVGCTQTRDEKLKMALIMPGPFGFAFISFWGAFLDTKVTQHPQLLRRRAAGVGADPYYTYGTFGNVQHAGDFYGQIWVV